MHHALFSSVSLIETDAENIRDDVLEVLGELRHESPPMRKTEPLLGYLMYSTGDVTKDELILMITSCLEGDRVSSKSYSQVCLTAMMKFMGEHQLNVKFPDVWSSIDTDVDQFLYTIFIGNDPKKTDRNTWITNYQHALSLLMDIKLCMQMRDTNPKTTGFDEKFETLYATRIGQALFKKEGTEYQFDEYLNSAKRRLLDLEIDNKITSAMVDAFRTSMLYNVKQLKEAGHALWVKKTKVSLSFRSESVVMDFQSLNDYWHFPLESRVRSLGIQSNAVRRLPWEVLAYGATGKIPGLPMAVVVEPGSLQATANSRDAVLKVFAKYQTELTFQEMRNIYGKLCTDVGNHDRFCKLEVNFSI